MNTKLITSILIPVLAALGIAMSLTDNSENNTLPENEASYTQQNEQQSGDPLELYFIDVGQADSVLVVFPDKRAMLIDSGTSAKSAAVLKQLNSCGIKKIDYLIATHPHEDHIGGMDKVINEFEIGSIYMPKASATTRTFERLLTAISDKGLKVNSAKGGTVILDDDGCKVEFIAPNSDSYGNLNNYSAVTKITYKSTSFLLTGDAEEISENEMLAAKYNLKADVLKAGHHGSKTSSSQSFIDAVSPRIAVISCGKDNSYGHPHEETLKKFQNNGIDIYRTDELGTIKIISDGATINVLK